MPAPAGAITVLLPIYAVFLGLPRSGALAWLTLVYTLTIASLMVSRLPVFSGKRVGNRVPPELVGPLIVVVVLSIAVLIAYPWIVLTAGTLAYLGCLPFGWLSYRGYERRSREGRAEPVSAAMQPAPTPTTAAAGMIRGADDDEEERPSRLN
jgi:CDP-diacylglycerol---serine O-phosphatidyltransferase